MQRVLAEVGIPGLFEFLKGEIENLKYKKLDFFYNLIL